MRCTFIPLSHLHSADNLFHHNSPSSLGTQTDRGTTRAQARRGSPLPSFRPLSAPDASGSCLFFHKSLGLTHSPGGCGRPNDRRNIHRLSPRHASYRASPGPVANLPDATGTRGSTNFLFAGQVFCTWFCFLGYCFKRNPNPSRN